MRDLNSDEYIALERMVDRAGIQAVIMGLSDICGLVAVVMAQEQQDAHRAKRWATIEGALGVIVPTAEGM
jgi:hypothetical protein